MYVRTRGSKISKMPTAAFWQEEKDAVRCTRVNVRSESGESGRSAGVTRRKARDATRLAGPGGARAVQPLMGRRQHSKRNTPRHTMTGIEAALLRTQPSLLDPHLLLLLLFLLALARVHIDIHRVRVRLVREPPLLAPLLLDARRRDLGGREERLCALFPARGRRLLLLRAVSRTVLCTRTGRRTLSLRACCSRAARSDGLRKYSPDSSWRSTCRATPSASAPAHGAHTVPCGAAAQAGMACTPSWPARRAAQGGPRPRARRCARRRARACARSSARC
jgi:hypothetical protein